MGDIMDYLKWRGDLSLKQAPFNEVDHLILSQLAYVNFDGIVPGVTYDEEVTLEWVCDLFFKINDENEVLKKKSFKRVAPMLMKKMAETRRFKDMKLCNYMNQIDYKLQKQFAALQMKLEDETVYVAFRGTDDNLVGWKEDFNMSFMTTVPAQLEAVQYVNQTLASNQKKIRMGGHSKGGNLAIYAAVKCEEIIKEKIVEVYNNDGPGFNEAMITSSDYQKMHNKIKTIVPQSSIVGMFFEHEVEYTVVKSKQMGMMQHDAMSWEIIGTHFVYLEEVTRRSQILNHTLKGWINSLEEKEREQFIQALFSILEATGAKTISDLTTARLKKASIALKSYNAMEDLTKEMLRQTIKLLTHEYYKVVRGSLGKKKLKLDKK